MNYCDHNSLKKSAWVSSPFNSTVNYYHLIGTFYRASLLYELIRDCQFIECLRGKMSLTIYYARSMAFPIDHRLPWNVMDRDTNGSIKTQRPIKVQFVTHNRHSRRLVTRSSRGMDSPSLDRLTLSKLNDTPEVQVIPSIHIHCTRSSAHPTIHRSSLKMKCWEGGEWRCKRYEKCLRLFDFIAVIASQEEGVSENAKRKRSRFLSFLGAFWVF